MTLNAKFHINYFKECTKLKVKFLIYDTFLKNFLAIFFKTDSKMLNNIIFCDQFFQNKYFKLNRI